MGVVAAGLLVLAGSGAPIPLNAAGWISVGDYPADALSAHGEGRVGVRLAVRADGRVSDCDVTTTSGTPSLDTATCGLLFVRARFSPARDDAGKPVAGTFATRIAWRYPTITPARSDPAPAPIEIKSIASQQAYGSSILHVGADGLITRCDPTERFYANVPALPDICWLFPVGTRFSPPTVRAGKPVRRKVTVRLSIDSVIVS